MPVGGFGIGQGVFNARQAHAGATSVSGIGGAIRGILEDAKKKGLLQAQSDIQTQAAKDLFKFKQENTPERNVLQIQDGKLVNLGTAGAEDKVFAEKSDSLGGLGSLGALMALANSDDPEGFINAIQGTQQPTQEDNDGDTVIIEFSDGKQQAMTRAEAKAQGFIQ